MSNFKVGDKIRWKDTPSSDQGEIIWVGGSGGGGVIVCWDSQPLEGFHYTHKTAEHFEKAQKPADRPKYVIVQGKAQDVVAEVEQYLKQGYKLQGGVSMHQDWFAQALVLNEPC